MTSRICVGSAREAKRLCTLHVLESVARVQPPVDGAQGVVEERRADADPGEAQYFIVRGRRVAVDGNAGDDVPGTPEPPRSAQGALGGCWLAQNQRCEETERSEHRSARIRDERRVGFRGAIIGIVERIAKIRQSPRASVSVIFISSACGSHTPGNGCPIVMDACASVICPSQFEGRKFGVMLSNAVDFTICCEDQIDPQRDERRLVHQHAQLRVVVELTPASAAPSVAAVIGEKASSGNHSMRSTFLPSSASGPTRA